MKTFLFLILTFSFQYSFAQLSDAEVICHNLKGEVTQTGYFRIDKSTVRVFENTGGLAFYGQELRANTKRSGVTGLVHVLCGADLVSQKEISLVTCASGSQVRFLNQVLPPVQTGCK